MYKNAKDRAQNWTYEEPTIYCQSRHRLNSFPASSVRSDRPTAREQIPADVGERGRGQVKNEQQPARPESGIRE